MACVEGVSACDKEIWGSRIAGSKAAPVKLIVSQLAKRIKALQPTQLPIQFVQLTAQLRTLPSASDKLLEAVGFEPTIGFPTGMLKSITPRALLENLSPAR